MSVKIFTVPFNPEKEIFEDEDLGKFLVNKHVRTLKPQFFQTSTKAYWTVFIEYELVLAKEGEDKEQGLNEPQKIFLKRLKQWRAEKAEKGGVPGFIIATNKEDSSAKFVGILRFRELSKCMI